MRLSDYDRARELFESESGGKGGGKRNRQLSFDFERPSDAEGDKGSDGAKNDAEASKEQEPPPGSFAARLSRYLDLQQNAARRGRDRKRTDLDK